MSPRLRRFLVAAACAVQAGSLAAQTVMVAPHAVIIDDRMKTGSFTLVNQGASPAEIEISTVFGYPVTDSSGNVVLRTMAVADDSMPSAAGWIESFPRRLVLAPGARRVVRLLVTPPSPPPAGEYWARVVIAAREASYAPVTPPPDPTGIRIGLTLEVRTIIGLFYRRGAVQTAVTIADAEAHVSGDSLQVRTALRRGGNAAFVGSVRARLRDAAGVVQRELLLPLGVYYELEPRFALPLSGLDAGPYVLELQVTHSRPDLPPGTTLPVQTAERTLAVLVP